MATQPPTSPIDIVNLAFDLVKEKSKSSIEMPTTAAEEIGSRWYDHVRRLCLREYMWNFAQAYREMARSGDGVDGWEDAYTLPNDCVRINSMGEPPPRDLHPEDYWIMGRTIHATQGSSLKLRYNKDETDVALMDPGFINFFSLRLALKMAYKITGKNSVVEMINKQLSLEEGKCVSVDGMEKPPRRIQRSVYLAARRRGGLNSSFDNPTIIDFDS
jgi:hypothetical protein